MDTFRYKIREAEKSEKFLETCAQKAFFHTSYGFFATIVKECLLDDQNGQNLVTKLSDLEEDKVFHQLERKKKKRDKEKC